MPGASIPRSYGKYGGAWIEDCFKHIPEQLLSEYQDVLDSRSFNRTLTSMLSAYKIPRLRLQSLGDIPKSKDHRQYANVKICDVRKSGALLNVIGQFLIAKELGRSSISTGATTIEHLRACYAARDIVRIPIKIYAGRELAKKIRMRSENGFEIDLRTCTDLYDIPGLYAFQDWFKQPFKTMFVSEKANLGPYPHPAIAEYFYSVLARELSDNFKTTTNQKVHVFAPIQSGTSALGFISSFMKKRGVSISSVEMQNAFEEITIDACGSLTKARRTRKNLIETIYAPHLVHLWESKVIFRSFVSPKNVRNPFTLFSKSNATDVWRRVAMAVTAASRRMDLTKTRNQIIVLT